MIDYITNTLHFININWEKKRFVLKVSEFNQTHMSSNTKNLFVKYFIFIFRIFNHKIILSILIILEKNFSKKLVIINKN